MADSFHKGAGHKTHGRAKGIQGEGNGRSHPLDAHVHQERGGQGDGELEFVRCSDSSSRVSGSRKTRCYTDDFLIVGFGLYENIY